MLQNSHHYFPRLTSHDDHDDHGGILTGGNMLVSHDHDDHVQCDADLNAEF